MISSAHAYEEGADDTAAMDDADAMDDTAEEGEGELYYCRGRRPEGTGQVATEGSRASTDCGRRRAERGGR